MGRVKCDSSNKQELSYPRPGGFNGQEAQYLRFNTYKVVLLSGYDSSSIRKSSSFSSSSSSSCSGGGGSCGSSHLSMYLNETAQVAF